MHSAQSTVASDRLGVGGVSLEVPSLHLVAFANTVHPAHTCTLDRVVPDWTLFRLTALLYSPLPSWSPFTMGLFCPRRGVPGPLLRLPCPVVLLVLLSISCSLPPTVTSAASVLRTLLAPPSVRVQRMLVDRHADVVIDTAAPHFTWRLPTSSPPIPRAVVQSAYQLRLSTVERLRRREVGRFSWDTGKVLSNQSRHVGCGGVALESDSSYEWSIRYWDGQDRASEWATGVLRTGFASPAVGFTGQWIGHGQVVMNELRRDFTCPSSLTRATIFLAVAGYYELYVNGTQVYTPQHLLMHACPPVSLALIVPTFSLLLSSALPAGGRDEAA